MEMKETTLQFYHTKKLALVVLNKFHVEDTCHLKNINLSLTKHKKIAVSFHFSSYEFFTAISMYDS